jgi:hypothetical protein
MLPLALALAASLATTPAPAGTKSFLKIEVKPETAVLFVDGVRRGTGAKPHTIRVEPGRHDLKVVNKGDEHQEQISVKKGETKQWSWAFEDDRPQKKAAEPDPSTDPEPSLDDMPQ